MNHEHLIEDFLEFELTNNLFELEFSKIKIWDYIRVKVFNEIKKRIYNIESTTKRDIDNPLKSFLNGSINSIESIYKNRNKLKKK